MVKIRDITDSNGALAFQEPGLTAVFAGATAGIGYNTLFQLATLANSPKVYIIGRSRAKFQSQLDTLQEINPDGTFIFLEAQITLLKEVNRVCAEILSKEEKIDILCMSPGYLSLKKTRDDTEEDIEADLALQYYSRMLLAVTLLPLLKKSPYPHVVSILAAGKEGTLDTKNLDFRNNYSRFSATLGASMMTTLFLEELAKQNPTITLIHHYPGAVDTGITNKMLGTVEGLLYLPAQALSWGIRPIYWLFTDTTPQGAGMRALYVCTSAMYPPAQLDAGKQGGVIGLPVGDRPAAATIMTGGRSNGVYRTNFNGDTFPEHKLLTEYRNSGVGKIVYDHTIATFERVLGK